MELKGYTTKGKNNFDKMEIDNDKLRPVKRGLKIPCTKDIYAFDFEVLTHTRQGERKTLPVMLGIAGINEQGQIIKEEVIDRFTNKSKNNKKMIDAKFEERRDILIYLLKQLTKKQYRSDMAQNFFYNIKYDFGILASLMTEKEIEILYYTEKVEIDKFIIEVVGNKMFVIKKKGQKRQWVFYDLANFTMTNLDKASKKWLGEETGGKTEGFDTAKIFNDENLLKEVYEEAKSYCLNDVIITAKLGLEVRKYFEKMNIPFSKPISTASLFKAYMGFHEKPYPTFDTTFLYENKIDKENKKYHGLLKKKEKVVDLQKTAWEGYYGGLFEMYKRGYFKDVIGLDYNSMYPSMMVDLPDLSDCDIYELDAERFNQEKLQEDIKKADWGVIRAKVWTKEGKIQIFPVRAKINNSEKVIRPVMQGQEVVMTKQMFDFFTNKYPHFEAVEVIGGYAILEREECKRPFAWLKDQYDYRVEIIKEHGKEDKRQLVIKIILNAGYGVCAETIPKEIYVYEDGEIQYDKTIIQTGKFFRPFYAMHITELSRLRIYEDIFESDIEKDCIGVATDCIFVEGEGKQKLKNSPHYAEKGKPLGKLMLEKEGEMLVIGNGIYQFRNKEGEVSKTTRGFNEKKFPNLFEEGQELQRIPVYNTRPKTWREIAYKYNFDNVVVTQDDIGLFFDEEKECDINMDNSRRWQGSFENVKEMFSKQIESKPIILPKEE